MNPWLAWPVFFLVAFVLCLVGYHFCLRTLRVITAGVALAVFAELLTLAIGVPGGILDVGNAGLVLVGTLLASAVDGVVSPETAAIVGRLGGLAVLNLEGVFTRYEDAEDQLARIARLPKEAATREMQEFYREPVKPELITRTGAPFEKARMAPASPTPMPISALPEITACRVSPAPWVPKFSSAMPCFLKMPAS